MVIRNNIIKYGLFLFLGASIYSCSPKTYAGRWLWWNASGIDDYKHFPTYDYQASETPFYFAKNELAELDNIMVPENNDKKIRLIDALKQSHTTAFIVIRNDTVLYEKYLNGYERASLNTSFSVAKSITSFMIGKAIDEKLIHSLNDPVTQYLPQLLSGDKKFKHLRIAHLMDMCSGIQYRDTDLIWGDKPKAYYHPNLRKRTEQLSIKLEPGEEFQYNPYNTILTGMIIEATSGMSAAEYFQKKIWNPLEMEYSGSWSLDSEASNMTKMESGLNLRAIDFAKFGRLVLNLGKWNHKQVLSTEWMDDCFAIAASHKVPEYGDHIYYKNYWWVYSKDGANIDIISGWGHLGQYLYVFPESNTIIVRMGKQYKGIQSWGKLFKTINELIQHE